MNIDQYRKRWLRQHKRYEKIAYKELIKGFRDLGDSIPFLFMTEGNYEDFLNTNLKQEQFIQIYFNIYREIGLLHGSKISKQLEKNEKDLNGFLGLFERELYGWLLENVVSRVTTVRQTYLELLKKIITDEIANGKSMSEIATIITKKINQRNFYRWQALRIARTETTAASNYASLQASRTTSTVYDKVWISAVDNRTRKPPKSDFNHLVMNEVVVPKDKPFKVPDGLGFQNMQFPGDPKGSASNVINCRCSVALVPRRDKDGNIVRNGSIVPKNPTNTIDDLSIRTFGTDNVGFDVKKHSLNIAKELGLKDEIRIVYNPKSKNIGGGTGWRKDKKGEYGSNLKIDIYGKLSDDQIKKVINHEMKHIQQMQTKRFAFKDGFYYWEGKKIISSKTYSKYTRLMNSSRSTSKRYEYYKKYVLTPWELEAHKFGDAFGSLAKLNIKMIEDGMPTDIIEPIKWDKEIPYSELTELDKEELNK